MPFRAAVTDARVIAIGREGLSKGAGIVATGDRARFGRPFLLRVAEGGRGERYERADAVIDARHASPFQQKRTA